MSEETELDAILDEVYDWICDFVESNDFGRLGPEHQDEAEDVVLVFAEFMVSYHGQLPEEWDVREVEECLLETFPRKMTAEEPFFRAIAPVLALFLDFAGRKGFLANGVALSRCVQRIGRHILDNCRDPRFWGPAKSLAMAAIQAGIDPTDPAEMDLFVEAYNQMLMRQYNRSTPPQPKVGRNDPCPCGSGKKYKKCCGQ
jgi:hypothetical protein